MQKKLIKFSVFPIAVALLSLSFSTRGIDKEDTSNLIDDEVAMVDELAMGFEVDTARIAYPVLQDDYNGFKAALGFRESQGKYHLINPYGYMGKYQFGKITLAALGIHDIQDFLMNPALQEEAFYAFMARNKWILEKDIKKYSGTYIDGVQVTESGILAAAHLAGPGGVRKYLRSGGQRSSSDAFGTTVRHYLQQFGGYDVSSIKPIKNATVQRLFASN